MAGGRSRPLLALGWLGVALCAAGLIAALAVGSTAMREVMVEQGGFCASGGPYEIANPCDEGVIARLFGSVFAGLAFAGIGAVLKSWVGGPRIGLFAPLGLIFAVLGWNFIDLGLLDPPADAGDGPVWGWVVSGAVFWLMAIGFMIPALLRLVAWVRRGGGPEPKPFSDDLVRAVVGTRGPPDADG